MDELDLLVDATGKRIPLNTRVLYSLDGKEHFVVGFDYLNWSAIDGRPHWFAIAIGVNGSNCKIGSKHFYLEKPKPDSFGMLITDLQNSINGGCEFNECSYVFGSSDESQCGVCRFLNSSNCAHAVIKEVIDRINRIRGDE